MLTRGAVRTFGVCTRYCTRYTSSATDEPEFDDFEEYPSGNMILYATRFMYFHYLFRVSKVFYFVNLISKAFSFTIHNFTKIFSWFP